MRLVVTILEPAPKGALDAVRTLDSNYDGVELRAEEWGGFDLGPFRAATAKALIVTRRGRPFDAQLANDALAAGADFVDVEWTAGVESEFIAAHREQVVLSHHDFEELGEIEEIARAMLAYGCRHTKIAVTPRSFAENQRLLLLLETASVAPSQELTVIGMGERGLYSRILAPFLGSALAFVSPENRSAAPGQLSLPRALDIYGDMRESLRADFVFAVAGNPAGHSLSPSIHNRMFRKRGAAAAYTIASFENFGELEAPLLDGTITGLSVTAPFKQDAWRFARRTGASIGGNAVECEAVNTLVRISGRVVADNTDVDGFAAILSRLCRQERQSVALVGAGGTARAALVALDRAGMDVTIFNRSRSNAEALAAGRAVQVAELEALRDFGGEIIINTAPPGAALQLPERSGITYVEASYGSPSLAERHARYRERGIRVIEGIDLLEAQAVRQHELFMRAIDDQR